MLLTKYSIKIRLIVLCLVPLIIILGFSYSSIGLIQHRLHSYTLTTEKIESLELLTKVSNQIYQLLSSTLYSDDASLNRLYSDIDSSLNKLATTAHTSEHDHHGVESGNLIIFQIEDLKYLIHDLKKVDKGEIVDLGNLIFEVIYELNSEIHKSESHASSIDIHKLELVFSDLNWFVFWMQKEAWLVQVIANQNLPYSGYRSDYFQISERQQFYLDKFINGADSQQLKSLVSLFARKEFTQGNMVKEQALSNQISAKHLKSYIDNIEQRYNLVNQQISVFTDLLSSNLVQSIKAAKRDILVISLAGLVCVLFLFFLGTSTLYRINTKLKKILVTMGDIGQSKVERIETDGNDEFTRFAHGLNRIISEQKEHECKLIQAKEAAVSANRAKSAFLANMSHEIRTPLNGIIGMTEILSESHLNPSQRDVLADIDTSSQSLLILLNDILDLSKIESGNLVLSPNDVDLREVVYESVNMMTGKAVSQLVELAIDIDENIPNRVKVDEFRLKQILMNLLSNAVKFTKQGLVTTKVEFKTENDQSWVKIRVIDTGVGIDKSKLDTIFNPFTQEDGSITRKYGGTGLGLAICCQLIELMEGTLTVDSTKGLGSSFDCTIPIDVSETQPADDQFDLRALLISNGSNYVDMLSRECKRYGVELNHYSDVEQCQSDISPYDLILYCKSREASAHQDVSVLRKQFPSAEVVACQHHLMISPDLASLVTSSVTLPVLGRRFASTLSKCVDGRTGAKKVVSSVLTSQPVNNSKRVLVVEDNLMNQKIASFFLDKIGMEYSIASNGLEAVEAIARGEKFTAILMDCMMPVMDGLTATKKIREWEVGNSDTKMPIIALTASVLDEEIASCFEAGMDAYLPKPYKSQQLFDIFTQLKLA
ncbi:response regulator [Vibrio sp. ZSDE26]|uniref:Sensory/regulatory protein RpfC n=1 Tax=Vibrio amylolyticus TaxID=2847292 RepID=A0A9X2BI36_9VIBR|nr:ATP-binding protein [Vibrio amylolyticus]MCK6264574.1 response regulator [Vibrio amylolyticus]